MTSLASCYFCGAAVGASLDEHAVPAGAPSDEQVRLTLCSSCAGKLDQLFDRLPVGQSVDAVPNDDRGSTTVDVDSELLDDDLDPIVASDEGRLLGTDDDATGGDATDSDVVAGDVAAGDATAGEPSNRRTDESTDSNDVDVSSAPASSDPDVSGSGSSEAPASSDGDQSSEPEGDAALGADASNGRPVSEEPSGSEESSASEEPSGTEAVTAREGNSNGDTAASNVETAATREATIDLDGSGEPSDARSAAPSEEGTAPEAESPDRSAADAESDDGTEGDRTSDGAAGTASSVRDDQSETDGSSPAPGDATDASASASTPGTAETADGDGGDAGAPTTDVSTRTYNRVVRLLQNREFPVDRVEFETLATSAYELEARQVGAALDVAVEKGLLDERDGQLHRPE